MDTKVKNEENSYTASGGFHTLQSKLYLNTHLNPILHYPLPSSWLSENIYTKINKAHIPQAISLMGFN